MFAELAHILELDYDLCSYPYQRLRADYFGLPGSLWGYSYPDIPKYPLHSGELVISA